MTALVEMILWPHFTTGSIEFRMDPGDPWQEAVFSQPLPILDALATIEAQINATIEPEEMHFVWHSQVPDAFFIQESSGNLQLRLSPCMAYLMGFASTTIGSDDVSTLTPAGIGRFSVGRTFPRETDQRESEAISAGRALTYGYGRSSRIDLSLIIDHARWAVLETSPIVGSSAIKVTWDNSDPYGEDDLDGYVIAYPTQTANITNRGNGYPKTVALKDCTLMDPGESQLPGQDTAWANFWGAVRHGYKVVGWVTIDGAPVMCGEWLGDAIAPAGYTLEAGQSDTPSRRNEGLILDDTSRIGSALDEKTHFAKAFDQEYRFFATPVMDALFARPTKMAELAADIDYNDTVWPVKTTAGWPTSGDLYIGTELAPYGARTADSFTGITRGGFGRARRWKKGTPIWNGPVDWYDRRVERYAVLVDPSLRYVQDGDVLSDAIMLGAGYVDKPPYRDGPTWRLDVRDQVREMSEGLGVAASGTAKWTLDEDSLLEVDNNVVFSFTVEHVSGGAGITTEEEFQIRPLLNDLDGNPIASQLRRSQIMDYVAKAIDDARAVDGAFWEPNYSGENGLRLTWRLTLPVTTTSGVTKVRVRGSVVVGSASNWVLIAFDYGELDTGSAGQHFVPTEVYTVTNVTNAGLAVVLDEGNANELPTSGFLLLEGDGNAQHLRYIDLVIDPVDFGTVNVILDTNSEFTGDDVQRIARDISQGASSDVSVKFYWRDSGTVPNALRRAIVSTGDGVHGAYDTLAAGQGLALPYIDAGSFDEVFGDFFLDLSGIYASEAGTSLQEMFSGLLRLSQRGIVSGWNADSSLCWIKAINTGSTEGYPKVTITDRMLVAGNGKRPVRALSLYEAPRAIEAKCRTVPVGDVPEADAVINCIQTNLTRRSKIKWKIDIYGFRRRELIQPAKTWGLAWARSGENRQVIELDIPPWYDVQAGDTVHLDIDDVQLFDYAVGADGVDTPARCIGRQISRSGIQTLTLVLDGILSPGPMSPSLAIEAVNGTATSPTSIDLDESLYEILNYAKGGNTDWKLLAYKPGQDTGHAEYTVGAISLPGGGVARVAVSASPSSPTITLTTDFRITWPVTAESTDEQNAYLHADQVVQWS